MTIDVTRRLFTPAPHARFDMARTTLPPRLQLGARRTVLDISEFFGDTSGGVRTYLVEKARYVERSPDLRQTIVLPGAQDAINDAARVRCYRLRGPRVPTQAPYRFMLAVRSNRRIVEHERPDVIEIGSLGLAPWNVARVSRRLGIPLVSFFHSHLPQLVAGGSARPSGARRAGTALAWQYLRRLDRLYARTVVSSQFAANELAHAGLERTTYVPLGVDLELFHPARRANQERVRARLGIAKAPLAVYAGRIAAEKQLTVLLDAWRLVARRTGASLVLVGTGPLKDELRTRYPESSVRWLPFESDRAKLADLLAAADLAVAPGPIETFGLAALEALACGTPVLAPDRGGGAELVARSGGGALYPMGDSHALADQAERLLGDHGRTLGMQGRRYAEQTHRWDNVFDAMFRVYDDVVAGRA